MAEIKGRIVIVDDELEMRSLLQDFFTNLGFSIQAFPNALDALQALSAGGRLGRDREEGDIDVVISDIKMPQMDGIGIRSHPPNDIHRWLLQGDAASYPTRSRKSENYRVFDRLEG